MNARSVGSADTSPAGRGGLKVGVFLRAINLAGKRLVMADFKRALAEAGFPDAQTVVATGNAVIAAPPMRPSASAPLASRSTPSGGGLAADRALEATIEAGLAATLGQSTEVFVRDGAALAAIVAGNPFPKMAAEDPSHLVVVFLKGQPGAAEVEALRGRIKGPEEVAAGPGCLYASYPDDIGHSKLTAAMIERALKLRGTARNWNTVSKMAELMRPT